MTCCNEFARADDSGDISQVDDTGWRMMVEGYYTHPVMRYCPWCGSSVTPLRPVPMTIRLADLPRPCRSAEEWEGPIQGWQENIDRRLLRDLTAGMPPKNEDR